MKPIQIKDSRIPKMLDVSAITLYPFIFYAEKEPEQVIINHEFIHVEQIRRLGWFKFYFLYLKEYFTNRYIHKMGKFSAYKLISFEVEAYKRQGEKAPDDPPIGFR